MRKQNYWSRIFMLALALSLTWGYTQYETARKLTIKNKNQYQQSYKDMITHLDTSENFLAKAMGSKSNNTNLINFTGAWEESAAALNDLSNLPVDDIGSPHISEFLNRSADFTYLQAQKLAGGGSLKPEEEKVVVELQEQTRKIAEDLSALQQKADYEGLEWNAKPKNLWNTISSWFSQKAFADSDDASQPVSMLQGIQLLDTQLQKLPPFQYQGKFSGPVTQEPKGLPQDEVPRELAEQNLQKMFTQLGLNYALDYKGDAEAAADASYSYKLNDNTNSWAEVSKRGGVVLAFNDMRDIGERILTTEQAIEKGQTYLTNVGFQSMVLTSQEDNAGYLTLSYAEQVNGVKVYSDKIILRVAMDNGQCIGFNARPYYIFHFDRKIDPPKLTVNEAAKTLKPELMVNDTSLVLLAKDNYEEILCYEFRAGLVSEEFLIYVNANTAIEEMIYRVITTPQGEYLQ